MYRCSANKLTIGYGCNIDEGISEDLAREILWHQIREKWAALTNAYPWVRTLDNARQEVLLNMAFNMGLTRLGGFRKMLAALRVNDHERAADEMVDSDWYRDLDKLGSRRAKRLTAQMRDGKAA